VSPFATMRCSTIALHRRSALINYRHPWANLKKGHSISRGSDSLHESIHNFLLLERIESYRCRSKSKQPFFAQAS
jgi:hypothetical protein